MSQNILITTSAIGRVQVRAGWDDPLQEIFCNVQPLEEHSIEPIDPPKCLLNTSYASVQQVVDALTCAKISLPHQMIRAIQLDSEDRIGNVVRWFNEDGTIERTEKATLSFQPSGGAIPRQ